MHSNHLYNLISQMTEEQRSLYRIKDIYKKDSADCKVCSAFWDKMEKDKEDHLKELTEMVKGHME